MISPLATHHFKKDLRQARGGLLMLGILLLLDLIYNLNWGFLPASGGGLDLTSYYLGRFFLEKGLSFLPVLLLVMIPMFVVLPESPAKQDGFLRTRPLPRRDWWLAKTALLGLVVIGPVGLQEFLHLILSDAAFPIVIQGTLERVLIGSMIVLLSAAFAALWPTVGQWYIALAATLGGLWMLGIAAVAARELFPALRQGSWDVNFANGLVAAGFLTAALLALAVLNSRRQWSPRRRSILTAILAGAALLILLLWPWNFLALRPETLRPGQTRLASADIEIPRRAIQAEILPPDQPSKTHPQIKVTLTSTRISTPENTVVHWSVEEARLVIEPGTNTPFQYSSYRPFSTQFSWRKSEQEQRCLSGLLSSHPLVRQPQYVQTTDLDRVFLGVAPLPEMEPAESKMQVQARLRAEIVRWRIAADIPLQATEPVRVGEDSFRLIKDSPYHFQLSWEGPRLLATGNPKYRHHSFGRASRYAFAFFLLEKNHLLLTYLSAPLVSLGSTSAYARSLFALGFDPSHWPDTNFSTARLIIFEREYIGGTEYDWESPKFSRLDLGVSGNVPVVSHQERLSREAFKRRFDALNIESGSGTQLETRHHLADLLQLLEAHGRTLEPEHAAIRQLIDWVPDHLSAYLDVLPVCGYYAQRALLTALIQGVDDDRKGEIINRLHTFPELSEVILSRGWEMEAKPETYRLLDRLGYLPHSAWQAVAWHEDPVTYPRFIAELEANPDPVFYDLLSNLEGIQAALDRSVRGMWTFRPGRTISQHSLNPVFKVALRHGLPEALAYAYQLLRLPDRNQLGWDMDLEMSLRQNLDLADIPLSDRSKPDSVEAWLLRHRPEDFVYHPLLRRFTLRANPTSNAD